MSRPSEPNGPSRLPAGGGTILAWCFYDFANSAFTTIIVTVAFSVYFTEIVAPENGEAWWGRGYGASMLVIGLLAPVLGAMADRSASKKRFLVGFTLLSVVATAGLYFVGEGDLGPALILFALGNIGFNGGITFYNAYLKELAPPSHLGRISGYGWGLGYVGGLVSLVLVFPLLRGGLGPDNLDLYRLSFPATAIFFLIFALPAFRWLSDPPAIRPVSAPGFSALVLAGFKDVRDIFREIRRFRELFKFFLAYLIYNDAVNTVIVFAAIFATKALSFTTEDLIVYFIVMQVSSAAGAVAFGRINDRLGGKKTILVTLWIWLFVIAGAYFVETKGQFYVVGLVAGIAIGSNQSASRALLASFAPGSRISEFFGFFALTGKLAAVFGPIVYGELAAATGDQRIALLSIGLFFGLGMALMLPVREAEGIAAAQRAEEEDRARAQASRPPDPPGC